MYEYLKPLAYEIIESKLTEAKIDGTLTRPFFREHVRKRRLQLVIPVSALNRLEKVVLDETGFKKTTYHHKREGSSTIFIIDIPELAKENKKLAEKMVARYNEILEELSRLPFEKQSFL